MARKIPLDDILEGDAVCLRSTGAYVGVVLQIRELEDGKRLAYGLNSLWLVPTAKLCRMVTQKWERN